MTSAVIERLAARSWAPALGLAPLTLALWPVWIWYWQRLTDRSDEPLGIVALVTLLVILSVNPERVGKSVNFALVLPLLLLYAAALFFAPKLLLALLAVIVVGICLNGASPGFGLTIGDWGLLTLSLPVVATLNFYCGYPLRWLVCHAAVPLLNINGFNAVADGTQIIYRGQAIEIDAPCSGIRMLWAALYLACTLASLRGMKRGEGAAYVILAVVLAVFANVLRVTSLFYLESETIRLPRQYDQIVHEGVGVAGFFILAIGLLLLASRFAPQDQNLPGKNESSPGAIGPGKDESGSEAVGPDKDEADQGAIGTDKDESGSEAVGPDKDEADQGAVWSDSVKGPVFKTFLTACTVCAVLPVFVPGQNPFGSQAGLDGNLAQSRTMPAPRCGWFFPAPGEALQPVALTSRQGQIASVFPGEIKIFAAGHRTVVYRCMQEATRELHPAADCYRAGGYQIKFLPSYTDAKGFRWGVTEASRGKERLEIRERIFDNNGNNWTDVSSWYWSALTGVSKGPWWSVMIVGGVQGG